MTNPAHVLPHAATCCCDLCISRSVVTDVRPAYACEGGSAGCTGRLPFELVDAALVGDLSAFPYCRPCRIAAHADSVADEPVQGPHAADAMRTLLDELQAAVDRERARPAV